MALSRAPWPEASPCVTAGARRLFYLRRSVFFGRFVGSWLLPTGLPVSRTRRFGDSEKGAPAFGGPARKPGAVVVLPRQPAVIATGIAFFSYSYVLYFFLSWFPSYLMMSRHLDVSRMSLLNAVPWILGTFGLLLSGLISDLLLGYARISWLPASSCWSLA